MRLTHERENFKIKDICRGRVEGREDSRFGVSSDSMMVPPLEMDSIGNEYA